MCATLWSSNNNNTNTNNNNNNNLVRKGKRKGASRSGSSPHFSYSSLLYSINVPRFEVSVVRWVCVRCI